MFHTLLENGILAFAIKSFGQPTGVLIAFMDFFLVQRHTLIIQEMVVMTLEMEMTLPGKLMELILPL